MGFIVTVSFLIKLHFFYELDKMIPLTGCFHENNSEWKVERISYVSNFRFNIPDMWCQR